MMQYGLPKVKLQPRVGIHIPLPGRILLSDQNRIKIRLWIFSMTCLLNFDLHVDRRGPGSFHGLHSWTAFQFSPSPRGIIMPRTAQEAFRGPLRAAGSGWSAKDYDSTILIITGSCSQTLFTRQLPVPSTSSATRRASSSKLIKASFNHLKWVMEELW